MFNRRLVFFFLVLLGAFGVIAARLVQLQILAHQQYQRRCEDVMIHPAVLLPSIRGEIFDRNGKLLAENIPCFDLAVHYGAISSDPEYIERVARSRARYRLGKKHPNDEQLQPYIEKVRAEIANTWQSLPSFDWHPSQSPALSKEDRANLLKKSCDKITKNVDEIRKRVKTSLTRRRDELEDDWLGSVQAKAISRRITNLVLREEISFLPIISELDNATARGIQTALESPEWITLIPTTRRVYPYRHVAAQTIGTVGPILWDHDLYKEHQVRHPTDPTKDDSFKGYAIEGDIMGRSGAELGYDWTTLRGTRGIRQIDRLDNPVSGANLPPKRGEDLHLTIDIELQAEIELAMPTNCPGAAVVLDIGTGEVLALVSTPLFPRDGDDSKLPHRVSGNNSWMNRAVEAGYPPGSTVKPVVVLAALSERNLKTRLPVVTRDTTFHCPTDQFSIPGCYNHGWVDAHDAIRRSCNIYCAIVAERVRLVLPIWFSEFGLARLTTLYLPRESAGTLPGLLSQKSMVLPNIKAWQARQLAIGQGSLTVTTLQVANMMATLARRGVYLHPTLDLSQERLSEPLSVPVDPASISLILDAMQDVVHGGGTARSVPGLQRLGFRVAGKTGSAQYDLSNPEDCRCWFSGFAPADNPRIAFSVVIEHGDTGGKAAGPVAVKLLESCRDRGYIEGASSARR